MQQLFLKARPKIAAITQAPDSRQVDADGSGKVALTTLEQGWSGAGAANAEKFGGHPWHASSANSHVCAGLRMLFQACPRFARFALMRCSMV